MSNLKGFSLSAGVANSMAAIIAWFGLSSGLYALATGAMLVGFVETLIALAIWGLLLSGKLAAAAKNREVPPFLIWFFVLVTIIVSAAGLSELLVVDIEFLGEIRVPEVISVVSTVVLILLVGIFFWQLVKSRSTKRQV